jgi:hypothetical protein
MNSDKYTYDSEDEDGINEHTVLENGSSMISKLEKANSNSHASILLYFLYN